MTPLATRSGRAPDDDDHRLLRVGEQLADHDRGVTICNTGRFGPGRYQVDEAFRRVTSGAVLHEEFQYRRELVGGEALLRQLLEVLGRPRGRRSREDAQEG